LPNLDNILILGVDDDPGAIAVLQSVCDSSGYTLCSANSGDKALLLLKTIVPDVIITDIMMPGMDGFALVKKIKLLPQFKNTPVVMITALNEAESRIKGIECGCDDFMSKPFNRLEAVARINSLATSKRLYDELENIGDVLDSLARSVESRDPEIRSHIANLEKLASGFAEFLNLDNSQKITLHRGCALHDIGKISVPDVVLLKAGPLNEQEWSIMKQHSAVGAQILSPMNSLKSVIPIVLHHHERWDGTGYPGGLAGKEIPYLARVFQILDAFDALTRNRVYKSSLSDDRALAILIEETESGRWDPDLMASFIKFSVSFLGKEKLSE
jgi:putative two-component system response regulator